MALAADFSNFTGAAGTLLFYAAGSNYAADPNLAGLAPVYSIDEAAFLTLRYISKKRAGSFLSGRPRLIANVEPYFTGRVGFQNASVEAMNALRAASAHAGALWLVAQGLFPRAADGNAFPFHTAEPDNFTAAAQRTALHITDLALGRFDFGEPYGAGYGTAEATFTSPFPTGRSMG